MGIMKRLLDRQMGGRGSRTPSWEGPFDISVDEPGATQRFERTRNMELVEAFNQKIIAWSDQVKGTLPGSIRSEGIKGSNLIRSLRGTFKYDYGEIYRLGFAFKREGVFVHKGVGRGYVMRGGTVVKTSKTEGFNRRPKPWFNPVIEAKIPELEQIIREYTSTAIINSSRIFIR